MSVCTSIYAIVISFVCEVRRFLQQKKIILFRNKLQKLASLVGLAWALVRYLLIATAALFVIVRFATAACIRLDMTGRST